MHMHVMHMHMHTHPWSRAGHSEDSWALIMSSRDDSTLAWDPATSVSLPRSVAAHQPVKDSSQRAAYMHACEHASCRCSKTQASALHTCMHVCMHHACTMQVLKDSSQRALKDGVSGFTGKEAYHFGD